MPTTTQPFTIIKSITLKKKKYRSLQKYIVDRYQKLKQKCPADIFKGWCLFSTIMGVFTSKGDDNSTKLFIECLKVYYLPMIKIRENKDIAKIEICIDLRELNERNKRK